jgi:pimeloyl-ACP methyl ester carboxylesterase
MSQMVFIHGPGAGGCAESFVHQLKHYPGSLAPTLPGHLEGKPCPNVERYMEWLRGWLWSKGKRQDMVMVGFTLGACIALQYGLEYPDEVQALVLMTVAMRPKERSAAALELRRKAAEDPEMYQQWLDLMRHNMMFIDPELRERLIECHRKVGPMSQYDDFVVIDQFDVRHRINSLKPPLLLIRGADDPGSPPDYEMEIHRAVPGSRYLKLSGAGHFPMTEKPEEFNQAVDDFLGAHT